MLVTPFNKRHREHTCIGSRHKILAEDRDPFDVSLPLGLEISRGHRVGWLQKGTEKG